MKKILLTIVCLASLLTADAANQFVFFQKSEGLIAFTESGSAISIQSDASDYKGVQIAVDNLVADLGSATGVKASTSAPFTIFVGSIDKSSIKSKLTKEQLNQLRGKNEKFLICVSDAQIIIAGSDQRGTIYGIYELAEQLGVSPWAWWADVPTVKHTQVYLAKGSYTDGEPAVRYRGIFINDEAPCLTSWVKNTYGTEFGDHRFYARVFELILRLRGNFLWPAMWGWAFYADDPLNSQTAKDMGMVIGTSHHEPMARNHQEWARHRKEYGAWNYSTNQQTIDRFFREGMERAKDTEDVITIGMRGDGDEAMSKDTDTKLLEKVVSNQRKIIAKATGKAANKTPQVWALYKEVLDYYDAGMRVPDDVIMLLCDDNWGNVRRLPNAQERKHPGGWGMYYHVDYVGAPRNSKWLCNTPVQNMWEQLTLTYDYGVDKLWILNVGDIKPMEYSITEFLDLAWEPHRYDASNLLDHTHQWCGQQFGEENASEASRILNLYLKYAGRCTAEMLDAKTYNLASGEWKTVVDEFSQLELDALRLYTRMQSSSASYLDAYRQLILFPVQAMSNLYAMYYAQAMNLALYAKENATANEWADRVESCFKRDAELCRQYNQDIAGGKWNGMMTQKHIGYTSWNDNFPRDIMPRTQRVGVVTDDGASNANKGNHVLEQKNDLSANYVAIEAEHYFKATQPSSPKASWTVIPYMGRTLSGVAVMPYTEPTDGAALTYKFRANALSDNVLVSIMCKSNLAFARTEGHRYAVSLDGGAEQVINYNGELNESPKNIYSVYYPTVARRVKVNDVSFPITQAQEHTLTIRPLDPGIVFEKITIFLDGKKQNLYLGGAE